MAKDQLKRIIEIINEKKLSPKELKRLEDDILVIQKRLETGEYRVRSFSPKSSFDYQHRTEEFYTYLKDYCLAGQTFFKLFEKISLKTPSKILEFCPGWAPKVALGLYYLGFKGKLVLADKNLHSLQKMTEFMSLFKTSYKMEQKERDIFSLNGKYDWLIGNHIIDDLILNEYCLKNKIDPDSIYESERDFQSYWKNILDESKIKDEFISKLAEKIDNLTQKGGELILTQYQSMMERLLKLDQVTRFNQEKLKQLKKELIKLGWVDQEELVQTALKGFKGFFAAQDCLMMMKK